MIMNAAFLLLAIILYFPPSTLGRRISSFRQADLISRSVQYIHTSEAEKHSDSFTFSVSDGTHEVSRFPFLGRVLPSKSCSRWDMFACFPFLFLSPDR